MRKTPHTGGDVQPGAKRPKKEDNNPSVASSSAVQPAAPGDSKPAAVTVATAFPGIDKALAHDVEKVRLARIEWDKWFDAANERRNRQLDGLPAAADVRGPQPEPWAELAQIVCDNHKLTAPLLTYMMDVANNGDRSHAKNVCETNNQ